MDQKEPHAGSSSVSLSPQKPQSPMTRTKTAKARAAAERAKKVSAPVKGKKSGTIKSKKKQFRKSARQRAVIPAAMASKSRRTYVGDNTRRMPFCLYLGSLQSPGATQAVVLQSFDLNPRVIGQDSRLATEASIFSKYRYKNLKFHFEAGLGTTSSGEVFIRAESDPNTFIGANVGDELVRIMAASDNFVTSQVYRSVSTQISGKFFSEALYVNQPSNDPDLGWSSPGKVYFGCTGPLPWVTPTTMGHLYVEGIVEFSEPTLGANSGGSIQYYTWTTSDPSDAYPWGLVADQLPDPQNDLPVQTADQSPVGTHGNTLLWSETGTYIVITHGEGGSASTVGQPLEMPPGTSVISSPLGFTDNSGTQYDQVIFISVGALPSWTTWDNGSGTHNSTAVLIMRSHYPIQPGPEAANTVKKLQKKLNALVQEFSKLGYNVKDVAPDPEEEIVELTTTTTTVTKSPGLVQTSSSTSSTSGTISPIPILANKGSLKSGVKTPIDK